MKVIESRFYATQEDCLKDFRGAVNSALHWSNVAVLVDRGFIDDICKSNPSVKMLDDGRNAKTDYGTLIFDSVSLEHPQVILSLMKVSDSVLAQANFTRCIQFLKEKTND